MLYNIVRVLTTLLNMNDTHTRISIYRLGIGKRSNAQKFPMFDYKHVFLMKRQGKFFYEIYSIALFILCLNYIENILGTLWLIYMGIFTYRVHRVAMTIYWRTFHHDGKISPAWWRWGVHALPHSLYLPSQAMLWCTLQLRENMHYPYVYFSSTPICTLCLYLPQVDPAAV
jgi:hypothetical protein